MPFTNYYDQALETYGQGDVSYTPATTMYVGLSSTLPTQITGSSPFWNVTQPSGSGYALVACTNNTTDWTAVSSEPSAGYELQNGIVITFPTSTGAWNSGAAIDYFFVQDATGALASAGPHVLFFGTLSPAETVAASGVTLSFAIGALTTTLD